MLPNHHRPALPWRGAQGLCPLRAGGHVRDQLLELHGPLPGGRCLAPDPEGLPPHGHPGRPPGHRLPPRLRRVRTALRLLGGPRRPPQHRGRRGGDLERGHRAQRPGRQLRPAVRHQGRRRRGRGQLLPRGHLSDGRLLPQGDARARDVLLGSRDRGRDRRGLRGRRLHRPALRLAHRLLRDRGPWLDLRLPGLHDPGAVTWRGRTKRPPGRAGLRLQPPGLPGPDADPHRALDDPQPDGPLLRARRQRLLAAHQPQPPLQPGPQHGGPPERRGSRSRRPWWARSSSQSR